jgi:putative lipoic acid-binding regulatory protein
MKQDLPSALQFPLECHFRIITEDRAHMHFVIETVLLELGITDKLEMQNRSRQGQYVSYSLSTTVDSQQALDRIDDELRRIDGVRMVL